MSPTSPKSPCPICRKAHCTDEKHRPKKESGWASSTPTRQRRPDYYSSAQQRRRKDTVSMWLAVNGAPTQDGKRAAICPECGHWRTSFVADHEASVALTGDESGPLRVHCRVCSNRQASMVGHAMRKQRR